MQNNFNERAAQLQNKTQRFMDQINQLESEMKNHLIKAKIDVQNLHESHNHNIKDTQIRYEGKIRDNKNEHAEKDTSLLQTLDDQNRHID